MRTESRIDRAAKWADEHKPKPSFAEVYVLSDDIDEGLTYGETLARSEIKTIPFDEVLNADGSFREGFHFKRFVSCKMSDVKRLLDAYTIEAYSVVGEKDNRMEW